MLRQARTQRVVSQLEGLDEEPSAGRRQRRACARWRCIPSSNFALGEQERFLRRHAAAAAAAWPPMRWRCSSAYREYQQRALARDGPAPDVHRHADAGAGAGGVRRAAAGGRARQPARAAAAAAGRGRAPGGARRPERQAGVRVARRARRPDALVRRHDRAALRCARAGAAQRGAGRGRARQPADHPRQPDRRRDRVRPQGRASTPSTPARRASCACRCRPTAAAASTRCPAWATSRQAVWQRFELHAASPEAGERDHWQDSFELQIVAGGTAASATRSRCWCAARRCRRARA